MKVYNFITKSDSTTVVTEVLTDGIGKQEQVFITETPTVDPTVVEAGFDLQVGPITENDLMGVAEKIGATLVVTETGKDNYLLPAPETQTITAPAVGGADISITPTITWTGGLDSFDVVDVYIWPQAGNEPVTAYQSFTPSGNTKSVTITKALTNSTAYNLKVVTKATFAFGAQTVSNIVGFTTVAAAEPDPEG